jgi:hypothetical protein
MGFRHFAVATLSATCLLGLTIAVVGCSISTNDTPAEKGPLKLTLPQEACLADQAIPAIQKYFESNATPDEVALAWDCISGALTKFTTSTRGSNPDYFTSRELRTFLETYYLGDIKVSDLFLAEIMRVKQLLLGGANDRLTKDELAQAQQTILVLRSETLKLLPYIKYVTQKVTVDEALANRVEAEAAIEHFRASIGVLGTLLGRGQEQYTTQNFETLLTEMKPLFKDWTGPEQAIKYLPTFAVIKALVLNPPGESIAPAEWQPLMTGAGRVYALVLRQQYLMAKQNLLSGAGLAQMRSSFEEVISIIRSGIDAKSSHVIAYPQIDDAIDEMIRLGVVPEELRDTTLKGVVRTMFSKFLNPASSGSRPKVTGLNATILERIRQQGAAFLEMQARWDAVTQKTGSLTPAWKTFVSTWQALPPASSAAAVSAAIDLTKLFTLPSPLSYRDNGTVVFDNRLSYLPMDEKAFTRYNWQSAVTRLLVQGYATDAIANKYTGLKASQVKAFFSDVHDLGVDMELLEPKDDDLWQTSFNESNMFMLSALNDDYMSYTEVFDYLAYLLGGGVMSDRMYNETLERCAHVGVDGFNRPTMDVNCFRARYGQKYAEVHAELPWWVKTQKDAGTSGWAEMEQNLEKAARTNGYSDDPISTSDITRMTMVQQYIESLYVRYDANRDGLIGYDEAQKALPLFKALLVTASGFTSDKKINALYMYILKNGKPPTSLGDKIYFQLIWLGSQSKWKKVTADRLKLLEVVGSLKSASATAAAAAVSSAGLPLEGVTLPVNPIAN